MTSLEKLVVQRVKLLIQIKELKEASSALLCEYQFEKVPDTLFGGMMLIEKRKQSCIEMAYRQNREMNSDLCHQEYSYDEVFENLDEPPCEHCKAVRSNKKKRMLLRKRLGQINGCITKAGLRIIKQCNKQNSPKKNPARKLDKQTGI